MPAVEGTLSGPVSEVFVKRPHHRVLGSIGIWLDGCGGSLNG